MLKPTQNHEVTTFCGDVVTEGDVVCYLKTVQVGYKKRRCKCVGHILAIRLRAVIISIDEIDSFQEYAGSSFTVSKYSDIICKMNKIQKDNKEKCV